MLIGTKCVFAFQLVGCLTFKCVRSDVGALSELCVLLWFKRADMHAHTRAVSNLLSALTRQQSRERTRQSAFRLGLVNFYFNGMFTQACGSRKGMIHSGPLLYKANKRS